jgi:hypothetical protein
MKKKVFVQCSKDSGESLRIYATESMLNILIDKNYSQFFIDGTFKCVPKGKIFFLFFYKIILTKDVNRKIKRKINN